MFVIYKEENDKVNPMKTTDPDEKERNFLTTKS